VPLLDYPVQHHDEPVEKRDTGKDHGIRGGNDEILIADKRRNLFPRPVKKKSTSDKRENADGLPDDRHCFVSGFHVYYLQIIAVTPNSWMTG
jgi:hypothetical protein